MYDGYHFWGMHLIWWFIWVILLFWIFFTPYDVRGKRKRSDSALDILQRRFASGEITKEEYEERKAIIERDSQKGIKH
jgi:putative membrane protein